MAAILLGLDVLRSLIIISVYIYICLKFDVFSRGLQLGFPSKCLNMFYKTL